jgi:energy-coupling factor transport system ATP-binding protein
MPTMIAMTITDLNYTYPGGVTALNGVNLHIAAGERVAIIGENGAGKSTLVRHLNGLLKPTSGSVTIGDWNTREHSVAALARRVGYVFQNPNDQLFARTVREEVAFGPKNLKFSPEAVRERVDQSLALVGLRGEEDVHPYDLNSSQRRLVALAATLALDTPVLVLDEPTTGQDAVGIARLEAVLTRVSERGKTVICITHDIDFCADHFPRVVVMAGAQIIADGPARQALYDLPTLERAGVEPPAIAQLALGLGMQDRPLTIEEFTDALAAESKA